MREINQKQFLDLLYSKEQTWYKDLIITFEEETEVDLTLIAFYNHFINCKFQGGKLLFFDSTLEVFELTHFFTFEACELQNEVIFAGCFVERIQFTNTSKPIKSLILAPKKLGVLSFHGSEEKTP